VRRIGQILERWIFSGRSVLMRCGSEDWVSKKPQPQLERVAKKLHHQDLPFSSSQLPSLTRWLVRENRIFEPEEEPIGPSQL
jgi:hypothetical protein